ncbi:MAG: hypothetical protein ACLGHY_15190, partial [Gammaproteobacteria bacterium]
YFAPTPRLGEPDDLRAFVERLHGHGLGVILDWVPAHFPKDEFALARFDGTALYEHEDPKLGWHPDWGTYIFNFGRNEVRNFLVANALYWLEEFHVDGLRVDAVASMLYLDYARRQGGRNAYQNQTSFLPLKLNMSGVIPPIFASSIILLPTTAVSWFATGDGLRWLKDLAALLAPGQPIYVLLYA